MKYDSVVHYHIYKNAGTTIDMALSGYFGSEHVELDNHPKHKGQVYNRATVEPLTFKSLAAHTFVPTIHRVRSRNYFPIVFLRHPLLRAASIYRFEKKRDDIPQAKFAKEYGFIDWLNWALDNSYGIRNFQTALLSMPESGTRGPNDALGGEGNLGLAVERLDEIPVVGIVEYFDESVSRMEERISDSFPGLKLNAVRFNTTTDTEWQKELASLQEAIPYKALRNFLECNQNDFLLYERYRARFLT